MANFQCGSCGQIKSDKDFYKTKSPIWRSGIIPLCKDCIVDIYETMVKDRGQDELKALDMICRALDKPVVLDVIEKAKELYKEGRFNSLITAYLSKVNLAPHNAKLYIDSDIFVYQKEDINTSETTSQDVETEPTEIIENEKEPKKFYDPVWRGYYTKEDLEYLNDYYAKLEEDYKIVTQNHKDYARKIAKASLAMDKAYDEMLRGVEGADRKYQLLKDTFDKLSQSAKFSENTRSPNDVGLGNFGKIFEMVENNQWVPQHYPMEQDAIDRLIATFRHIEKSL